MTVNWAIIGCGDVTEVKSGPGFQLAENSRLVAVMRRDGAKAMDYAARHGVPFWTDRAEEVIRHPEVNAVYVATPPGSHLDYALQVCAAGKPCYVEKPMARSAAECDAMNAAFDRAGLPLFVAYYRRALPRFLKARALVEAGSIGVVTGVTYRFASDSHRRLDRASLPWRWIAEEAGGGQFLDLGCHTLDILDFMLGPLEDASGRAANVASPCDVEDSVALQFRLGTGALGTATWNFASDRREDLIEIAGTDGEIALSTFGNEPVRLKRGDAVELFDLPNPKHIQQPFIATIVSHLNGDGECASTGATAVHTARVMDAALDGYYGGRADAFWSRPESWPRRRDGVMR
ncbi:MAG TPA: Gfo/Idh/MocA family oxidoreductase [Chthonomonadaceae bacterium]|nr:Gfo/Idh/MocA family oxidoreductase [Chthonomonadaceae bacterium]